MNHFLKIQILILLLLCSVSISNAETINLSTYYPAPFGAYDRLRLVPRAAAGLVCDDTTAGTFYIDDRGTTGAGNFDDDELRICRSGTFQSLGGVWTQNGNNIYPADTTNTNIRVGIGTGASTPEFKLSLAQDGGILARGTFGSGATLITDSPGTSLIWYPRKAAFRAGSVSDNSHWDDANIGNYSFSGGYNTKATMPYSTAFGYQAEAKGNNSVAMGESTNAYATSSISLGRNTGTHGNYSFAAGDGTLTGSPSNPGIRGISAVAMGRLSHASENYGVAMGNTARSWGVSSIAFGDSVMADGDYAISIGSENNQTQANYAIALGRANSVLSPRAIAIGDNNRANATYAVTIGHDSDARGTSSIAIGDNADAMGDHAMHISLSASPSFTATQNNSLIITGGNVGIGNSTPNATLDIVGDQVIRASTPPSVSNANEAKMYYDGTLDSMMISQNGGAFQRLVPTPYVGFGECTALCAGNNTLTCPAGYNQIISSSGTGCQGPSASPVTILGVSKSLDIDTSHIDFSGDRAEQAKINGTVITSTQCYDGSHGGGGGPVASTCVFCCKN